MGKVTRLVGALVLGLGLVTGLGAEASEPEEQGIGSCWEVKPICMPMQKPRCFCNTMNSCMWVCA
jgi:hypothetical protein